MRTMTAYSEGCPFIMRLLQLRAGKSRLAVDERLVPSGRPLDSRALDYRIDLSSDEIGKRKNIKPKHENHDRTQRAVRGAEMIEEMQVHAESV